MVSKVGGEAPHLVEASLGPPGPARPPKSVISGSGEGFVLLLSDIRIIGGGFRQWLFGSSMEMDARAQPGHGCVRKWMSGVRVQARIGPLRLGPGPDIGLPGRISAGVYSGKPQNLPSGLSSANRRAYFDAFPTRIWPKSCRKPDFRPGSKIE